MLSNKRTPRYNKKEKSFNSLNWAHFVCTLLLKNFLLLSLFVSHLLISVPNRPRLAVLFWSERLFQKHHKCVFHDELHVNQPALLKSQDQHAIRLQKSDVLLPPFLFLSAWKKQERKNFLTGCQLSPELGRRPRWWAVAPLPPGPAGAAPAASPHCGGTLLPLF